MPFPNIPWLSDSLKKRALRYLLQRYLGHFLLEKLSLEQLSVDLYDGTGCIRELALDVDGLNEELLFLPFKFAEGCQINQINCTVPWSELHREPCSLEIDGATLFCEVTGKNGPDKSIHDSSYLSKSMMSSSMQMAEEIVQTESEESKFDGLEMMAQLIDSVLRRVKVTATNTSFTIQANQSSSHGGKPTQVEFKIKFLRCEEDLMGVESEEQKRINFNTPGIIDKLLTFEGVEVLIDQRCVCKLGGKHMIKIKANEAKSDLQLYVGSPLMAIITSSELKRFVDVFCPPVNDLPQSKLGTQRMMSSQDCALVEEIVKKETLSGSPRNPLILPMSHQQRHWAGDSSFSSDMEFRPCNDANDNPTVNLTPSNHFSFFIKIPGVWLCLLDKQEDAPEVSIPFVNSSFASINDHLNNILGSRAHLRVLALPIQMEITYSNISIVAGDAMLLEQTSEGLTPIVWSNDHTEPISTPKYRCEIRGDDIMLDVSTTSSLWLDPTFLERVDNYFPSDHRQSATGSSSPKINLQIRSNHIKANLFFPVPDLRTEEQRVEDEGLDGIFSRSKLRNESLLFDIESFSLNTTLTVTKIACDSIKVTLNQPDTESIQIIDARRNSVDSIEVEIHSGPAAAALTCIDSELDRNAFLDGGMEDSIYYSNTRTQSVEAFQVDRKFIKERGNDSESVIAPCDREHADAFLNQARSCTQLYVSIAIPSIDVMLDKKNLELVYNRLGNDLVLWKPMREKTDDNEFNTIHPLKPTQPTYYACKSGLADSMDSESSFHSIDGSSLSKFLNTATISVTAQEVNFKAMLETGIEQKVSGHKVLVGVVVGLENDSVNTIFICGENAALTHGRDIAINSNTYDSNDSTSSLNMTFEIRLESRELKRLKIALQLCDAALQTIDIDIFKQFWEVINITDEVVLGYTPPSVQTELHISLTNGAISLESQETRPALFTFDDVYATSMVVENTSQILFRFIIEEASLYFSRNRRRPRSLKDCICVLDSGLTDLNLKVKDEERVEFKVSNNAINLRVCSDSLNALCELIAFYATPNAMAASPEMAGPEFSSPTIPERDSSLPDGELIKDALSDVNEDEDNLSITSGSQRSCECETMQRIDESGFFVLGDDDVGAGIKAKSNSIEPRIRVLSQEPIKVIDNHFGVTRTRPLPNILPETMERYLLEDLSVIVHLYGGKDFESDDERESDKEIDKDFETKHDIDFGGDHRVRFAEDGTVHLWESIDFGTKKLTSPSASSSGKDKSKGGRHRQNDTCVQLYLVKIKSLFETFEPTFNMSWRFVLMINEIEIRDRVSSSRINKMLYEYCSESMPRRNNANMLFIRATTSKNAADNNDECELKISIKPLRINIDQDTLMFLIDFFSSVNPKAQFSAASERRASTSSTQMAETQYASATGDSLQLDPNAPVLDGPKSEDPGPEADRVSIASTNSSKPSALYVKTFIFSPDVPIRLDYAGKRFDMEQGALAGILMGLAQLNESELRLKRLCNKQGLLGIDRVAQYAFTEWARDIKRYQLHSVLSGVGPMHSVVQLFQGVRDLVWMPIDQYRKDKRLVRGLQRGASSFSTSSAMAVLDLANRLVYLVQNTAQFAHDIVTPPSHGRHLTYSSHQLPSSQPRDLREGMTMGFAVVREGITDTVRAVSTASTGADNVSGAIGGVIRQMPSCMLSPVIRVAQATSNVILGARNQLTPEARRHDKEKYKDNNSVKKEVSKFQRD